MKDVFGRLNKEGNVMVLHEETGYPVTRLEDEAASKVYPLGSSLSCHYEHAEGIVITKEDAELLGIEME